MERSRTRKMTAGAALIAMGLALYVLQRVEGLNAGAIFFVMGGLFLAGYLYRQEYGLLIPAGILLGLGAGKVFEDSLFAFGEPTLLGLGCGFISIYFIALLYERRSKWWPLIPGAVLLMLGFPETQGVVEWLFMNWPLVLVIIGFLIFISAFGRQRNSGASE